MANKGIIMYNRGRFGKWFNGKGGNIVGEINPAIIHLKIITAISFFAKFVVEKQAFIGRNKNKSAAFPHFASF